ncbi:unnamed protein product [Rangifer tarandus platyrhynchus]|uniref:Uncharacterized protein n=2 Tax=Rangifer tarandus platyrhynchus TaxID=3082113 RepID=A0ACB0EDG6_RANTA|nr:unnamed protein product [Rangifer tarandus platyrhynchus]CAI9698341.1 unnamed protein product [Rangifer tarandus platyrhynchus]
MKGKESLSGDQPAVYTPPHTAFYLRRWGKGGAGRLHVTSPRLPALGPRARRAELVAGPPAGYRSPWVAASPFAFGLRPGQSRRRREGDNCPETQHLSWQVVQGPQERGPRASALTPQRPGMRAGARDGRGSRGRLQVFPLETLPCFTGKNRCDHYWQ